MRPFELNWATEQYKCWFSQYVTFGLLASLQAVNLFWLFLILRIAKNYVITTVVVDERSDNEEEEDGGKDEHAAVNVAKEKDGNDKATRKIEGEADRKKPTVLLNGKPVSDSAYPVAVVERSKKNR